MLYNPYLETFIHVAEAGSFNKAAQEATITPTALIKQINALEDDLDLILFTRTHRGVYLTEAGESLYKEAKYIIEYSRKALENARRMDKGDKGIIRVGTSFMTPAQFLTDLWPIIHQYCPEISLELVSFENTPENAREILHNLGDQIDIVAGVFDKTLLELRGCAGLEISQESLGCAVSLNHPLAKKDKLTLKDLYGQNLMIIHRNWSEHMDKVRDDLTEKHPQINIVDFDFYDVNVFNRCEREENLLLVLNKWGDFHPMMKVLPVEWDYTIPFGILYSRTPSDRLKGFLEAAKKALKIKL